MVAGEPPSFQGARQLVWQKKHGVYCKKNWKVFLRTSRTVLVHQQCEWLQKVVAQVQLEKNMHLCAIDCALFKRVASAGAILRIL